MPDYALAIRRAARRYGVRPELLLAQMRQESGLNPNAKSPAGASGIAQFMPGTAKGYGVNLNDGRAADDIDGAARHMRDLLRKYGGSEEKALAAYNAGAGAVDKYGGVPPYRETQDYVARILSNAKGRPAGEPEVPGTDAPPAKAKEVDPEARRSLLLGYLEERGKPGALLSLAKGLSNAEVEAEPSVYETPSNNSRKSSRPSDNLLELFWQGDGGINVKHGEKVPQGYVEGHADHVHVASGPKQIQRLMKLAGDMGLTVTSTTGGKHAPNSYHYSGKAIDVAGDPAKMRAFARRVAQMYGVR